MKEQYLNSKTALVLGWEFPPRMVGGLAVATYGIVEALRHDIHVILILPFKDESTPKLDNVTVYGLNEIEEHFPYDRIKELLTKKHFSSVSRTDMPQYYPNATGQSNTNTSFNSEDSVTMSSYSFYDAFQSDEVYGLGLWDKINAYVEITAILCEYLDFDLIHSHDWLTYKAGIKIKEKFKKPLCIHVHALETDRVGPHVNNEIYRLEKEAIGAADVVMPVSEYTKTQIVRYYVNYPDKIVPVHNAVEKAIVKRWKHKIPQKIVTFLGRITAQKGPEYLLETAAKVVAEYPEVRFVIAGKGDMLQPLINSTAYQGLSRYIIFAGFLNRSEVNALLGTTDIYFMPSVSEPFGLTALEAAHFQIPCVLTKQSGAAEVLHSALKADFWDTDLFASHIITLLKDEQLAKDIVDRSNEDLKSVSWHNSANKISREYERVLKDCSTWYEGD